MEFDWKFAAEILPDLLRGAIITVEATIGGFLVALVLGLVLAVGRRNKVSNWFCAGYVEFMRNTPMLVQLYFLFYVLPLYGIRFGALETGILGLGLYYSAYIAEVYRAGIDAVPRGQWEAAHSLEMPAWQTWTRIILPQAIPPMGPVLGNSLIGMFKETPLLAVITVPELFNATMQVAGLTYRYNEPYTMVALIFLAMSYPAALLVRLFEKRYRRN